MLGYVVLALSQALGLLLSPFGAVGVWLQLASLAVFGWWTGFSVVRSIPLLLLVTLALTAEVTYAAIGASRADTGLRRRVGFVALVGSGFGAILGVVLFPTLGSMFGALFGGLIGSLLGLVGAQRIRGGGQPLGSLVVATTMRTTTGVAIATFTTLVLLS